MKGIFHHPLPLLSKASSGSMLRPIRMLDAFKALGLEMYPVVGYGADRKKHIALIKQMIKSGDNYSFCYFETATIPATSTEPHHLPLFGEMDLDFLRWLRYMHVPVGVFYRDAQWKLLFSEETAKKRIKRRLIHAFYLRELAILMKTASRFYVPSFQFAQWLGIANLPQLGLLPPGCELGHEVVMKSEVLQTILYVGGISQPIYDIRPLLETAALLPAICFKLVCRVAEANASGLSAGLPGNVSMVSVDSTGIGAYYEEARLFAMLVAPGEYFSVAMPVKLFEALSYGLPVVAIHGSAAADFIQRHGIGWTVRSSKEAAVLINRLLEPGNPELDQVRCRVLIVANDHSWIQRARQVVDDLGKMEIMP
jgi:hypothetical protein